MAVVGASLAGCTAARLFGAAGARVALIERRPDPAAHKVVCTHAIQSSASPTIERIGLAPLLDARGAVRIQPEAWTPYGGWISPPPDTPRGYSVTRRTLDPLIRELAASTPGVELMTGHTAVGLLGDGRPAGVEVESARGRRRPVRARLVVAADGRGSAVARLARVPGRVRANNRFGYWAYWRGVRPETDRARVWFLDPDTGASFPNEDDLTLVAAYVHRRRLPEFRADAEAAYMQAVAALPDGPDVAGAERASKLLGKLELDSVMRPAAVPGLAFVGDAALATDPLFGVGCGWAFQSAEWLFDYTRAALLEGGELDRALARYRRGFVRRLAFEHLVISDISTGRGLRPLERAMFRAAAADPDAARVLEASLARRSSSLRLFGPRAVRLALRGLRPPGTRSAAAAA